MKAYKPSSELQRQAEEGLRNIVRIAAYRNKLSKQNNGKS